ncbi:MAG TPA: hypothetical protein VIS72_09680 [Anaerolineales bacterium]
MTRKKFVRLSGRALILAAIVLVAGFGIASGETNYDDPLGGVDRFYEFSQLILIPTSLLLYTTGMIGLRVRYGEPSGWLGKTSLNIAAIGGGLSFLSAIPLYALIDEIWMGKWWYLIVYSMLVMLTGLSLFGVAALNTKPFSRWNGIPLLTAIWFPLVFVIGAIVKLFGGSTDGIENYMAPVALLFMFIGSIALGHILQTDLKPIDPTEAAI